jgi:hypothetical protein
MRHRPHRRGLTLPSNESRNRRRLPHGRYRAAKGAPAAHPQRHRRPPHRQHLLRRCLRRRVVRKSPCRGSQSRKLRQPLQVSIQRMTNRRALSPPSSRQPQGLPCVCQRRRCEGHAKGWRTQSRSQGKARSALLLRARQRPPLQWTQQRRHQRTQQRDGAQRPPLLLLALIDLVRRCRLSLLDDGEALCHRNSVLLSIRQLVRVWRLLLHPPQQSLRVQSLRDHRAPDWSPSAS